MSRLLNRSKGLRPPPVGWMCHACGWSSETVVRPLRCPKCGNSAFERIGAAEAVREAERQAEGLGGPEIRRTAMAKYQCRTDGCAEMVSRAGGRCRSCAQRARRGRPRGARGVMVVEDGAAVVPTPPPPLVTTLTVAEALKAAGFAVKEVHVVEATILVRLTA